MNITDAKWLEYYRWLITTNNLFMCFILLSYYIAGGLVLIIQTSTNLSTFSDTVLYSKQDVYVLGKNILYLSISNHCAYSFYNIMMIALFRKTLKIITYKYSVICKKHWHTYTETSEFQNFKITLKIWMKVASSPFSSNQVQCISISTSDHQPHLLLGRCHNLTI